MKKAEIFQSEGDMKLFILARILQRNESRGVDLKESRAANISCQSSSMATPFLLLLSSSFQPNLVMRMAQRIKTCFRMTKAVLLLVLWRKYSKSFQILIAREIIDQLIDQSV